MTRTQRTYVVAAAVAAIVTAANSSQGAYFSQSWGWVALAFLVPATVLLILDRVDAPGRLRIAFAGLMVALAAWIALSTLWSVSGPASIREFERIVVYVAVALAVAVVVRRGDAPGVVGGATAGIVLVVSYGLGTRLMPDRLGSPDDPFNAYRLSAPLGYWNTFGLFAAMGVVLAVGAVAHARRRWHAVVAAAIAPVLVVALYFTFSRGSWVALAFAIGATVVLDPRRLRLVWSLVAIAPASCIAVAFASRQDALTTEDSPVAVAIREGHRVVWLLALLVPISAALGWVAHRIAAAVPADAGVRRLVNVALAATALSAVAVGLVAAGGADAFTDLRKRFDAESTSGGPDLNERLFSFSGNGRNETIAVAWDMGTRRPVAGTGAGTFEYIWYEERPSRQVVRDAHSLYVESFAELGLVGVVLLGGVLVVPLVGAARARRSRFAAPATGAYLAWAAAAALDWHWEMVGVTTTALLVGSVALLSSERRRRDALASPVRGGLIAATVALSVAATWSLVGNQALFAGREAVAREDWAAAREDGRRARALLFWSAEPDLVLGDAAAGLGDRAEALRNYRAAADADPHSWVAWLHVAQVARGAERSAAYRRVRELNPREAGLPGN
jgi:O-antigen ligase